ncbi:hypothetical protein FCH83_20030 [Pseudomonas putida]|nr:hypothetical protein [Pseudomonas putida]NTZ03030.1 hypothetical protein [Pseudomonas putida]NTZ25290.1 hypothetical protein [Pseudomonas putida]NTZ55515.1 hypothetical protein [Pseudomonas putida]NTZ69016.1 hypothetical protein [Pseudomonas putida]
MEGHGELLASAGWEYQRRQGSRVGQTVSRFACCCLYRPHRRQASSHKVLCLPWASGTGRWQKCD